VKNPEITGFFPNIQFLFDSKLRDDCFVILGISKVNLNINSFFIEQKTIYSSHNKKKLKSIQLQLDGKEKQTFIY
jgi:hypothetical protein